MHQKIFILVFFFSISVRVFGQSTTEAKKIIENLSWNSIHFFHSYRTFFARHDQAYYELIKAEKQSAELLFNSIDDPEKTAIIHIILTQMFEPDRNYFLQNIEFYSCSYINKNPQQLIGWHYIYNGLVWESIRNGNYSISKHQIERIKHLWDLRLHQNINSFDLDSDEIIKEVRQNDTKEHPCFDSKKYENNSFTVNISVLKTLIGTKYPNPLLDIVFKKLGNDSTMHYSKKYSCKVSYISYETDGIDFDFDDENTLRCIFIKPHYKGSLFNSLRMTDNKDEVKRKLGMPKDFVNIPRYKYDWIYENYNLLIAFGYTNRIIDLQINNGTNP